MSMEQEYLRRIADQLERIADALDRRDPPVTPVAQSLINSGYAAAVQSLIDMPSDLADVYSEPEKPAATRADAVAALNAFARVHGIEAGKKILNSFAPRLDEVPEDKLADLVALLKQGPSV